MAAPTPLEPDRLTATPPPTDTSSARSVAITSTAPTASIVDDLMCASTPPTMTLIAADPPNDVPPASPDETPTPTTPAPILRLLSAATLTDPPSFVAST